MAVGQEADEQTASVSQSSLALQALCMSNSSSLVCQMCIYFKVCDIFYKKQLTRMVSLTERSITFLQL